MLAQFELKTDVLIDEVRAGGRIPLIIGRGLTDKAREALGLPFSTVSVARSRWPIPVKASPWPRRWWGVRRGVKGIRPGTYCEPKMTTVGSQDTTGPITATSSENLACLGFSADLTMQSFCHTAAYPSPSTYRPTTPCRTSS
ncbi:hypothetical protein ACLK12_00675 [Escherichia coli]